MLIHAFFDGVADETAAALKRHAQPRRFATGEALFHHGEAALTIFGIVTGRVKVWRASEGGAALTLMFVAAGDLLGAISAAQHRPHPASATARTETDTLVWSNAVIADLVARDAVLGARMMAMLAGRAEHLMDRIDELAAPVEQRVARALCRLSAELGEDGDGHAVEVPISRGDLADLVGTTAPTLSRTLTRWRGDGIVGSGERGRIPILKLDALCAVGQSEG